MGTFNPELRILSHKSMDGYELKVCSICKAELPITEFNKNKRKSDGKQTHCRECNRKTSRKYYNANKALHKANTVERNRKNRILTQQYVYDYLKTNGCVDCGENDPCCLDFDHQRDKKLNVSKMVLEGYSLSSIIEEIVKCEIRCSNCHRKKTAKDFNWYCNIETE